VRRRARQSYRTLAFGLFREACVLTTSNAWRSRSRVFSMKSTTFCFAVLRSLPCRQADLTSNSGPGTYGQMASQTDYTQGLNENVTVCRHPMAEPCPNFSRIRKTIIRSSKARVMDSRALNRSQAPLDCGWYGLVRMWWIENSLRKICISSVMKSLPWFDRSSCGKKQKDWI